MVVRRKASSRLQHAALVNAVTGRARLDSGLVAPILSISTLRATDKPFFPFVNGCAVKEREICSMESIGMGEELTLATLISCNA